MKGFPVRPVPVENVGVAAKAVARRQAEQLTLVRRRAQPTAVYIARLTVTAVFAYLLALQLPGGSPRSVLAPLTALLVVQATLFNTIGTAIRRVAAVTVGVLAAVAVAAYVPFSWWVLGLLVAGTLALGIVLRLREEILEVPISAMLIFSVGSQAAASTRITETLVGAAAGLAAGLRVRPGAGAAGQGGGRRAEPPDGRPARPDGRGPGRGAGSAARGGVAGPDPGAARRDRAGGRRAGPGRGERPAEPQAGSGSGDPAAGLRDGVDTLERAATDMRVLARSVADSARLDSEHSPVREAETRARLAAVIAELSAAVRAYGQLLEAEPVAPEHAAFAAEPITEALEDHLEEAQRQQDQLADLLSTNPAGQPEGWQLRGEILAHVDRLRSELEPSHLPEPAQAKPPLLAPPLKALHARRDRHRSERHHSEWHPDPAAADAPAAASSADASATGPRRRPNRNAMRVRARRTASRVQGQAKRLRPLAAGPAAHRLPVEHAALVVAEAGLVVREEDLADEVTPAPHAGLVEDVLHVLLHGVR